MSLSNLPGRNKAGSMISGLLVAAMTTTSFSSSTPSISVSIWLTTLSVTCTSVLAPLSGAMASISSKNTTVGAACFAFLKVSRTAFSDSPTYLLKSSGPLMLMKFASLSLATALASMVLPVPGGPKSSMPLGGVVLTASNISGYFKGHSTASMSSCFAVSSPPISSHLTWATSTNTSLMAEGSMFLKAESKSALVTTRLSMTS